MGVKQDVTDRVFARLTALDNGAPKVSCVCSCGKIKAVNRNHLLSGNIQSCGCLRDEKLSKLSKSHGMSDSRLFSIYHNMKSRCNNPNVDCYQLYGGKGVSICEEWTTFEGFLKTLPAGYSDELELDRIDPDGDYTINNTRWANRSIQCYNKTTEFKGVTYCERDDLWRAKICCNGKSYQKYFKCKKDAELWRKTKELELFGFNVK